MDKFIGLGDIHQESYYTPRAIFENRYKDLIAVLREYFSECTSTYSHSISTASIHYIQWKFFTTIKASLTTYTKLEEKQIINAATLAIIKNALEIPHKNLYIIHLLHTGIMENFYENEVYLTTNPKVTLDSTKAAKVLERQLLCNIHYIDWLVESCMIAEDFLIKIQRSRIKTSSESIAMAIETLQNQENNKISEYVASYLYKYYQGTFAKPIEMWGGIE